MRALAISGSLRGGSFNTSLLQALVAASPDDVQWQVLDPALVKQVRPFDVDDEPTHAGDPALQEILDAVRQADVVAIATPEYNGSIPGQLKNLLDWASRPFDTNAFRNRPVAVLSASDGQFGAVWANNDLRKVLGTMGARIIERQVAVPMAHLMFDAEGRLGNQAIRTQLADLGTEIAAAGAKAPAAVAS